VQRPLTSGPRGGLGSPTLQSLVGWLRNHTLQEAVEGNPKLKVDGCQTPWSVGHVARPASHHLVCYQLNQVGNSSLDSYKYSHTGGNQSNTHYLVVLNL
jgi:hypothetical protein